MNNAKRLILFLCLSILTFSNANAQIFYEFRFLNNNANIKGLLVYYDADDIFYRLSDGNNIAQGICNYGTVQSDVHMFTQVENQISVVGTRTNFPQINILVNNGSRYIVNNLNSPNITIQVNNWREVRYDELTDPFLQQFFVPTQDDEYYSFRRLRTPPIEPPISSTSRMHLIVTLTNASDIKGSVEIDKSNVLSNFREIANELKLQLIETIIEGESFTKQNIEDQLRSLSINANDIVIFVYSGHGFRFSDQQSDYPRISCKREYQAISTSNSLELEEVNNLIISKAPRLSLVIGDCCNNNIGVTTRSGFANSLTSRNTESVSKRKLSKLFLESRGNILIAAASKGQTSCGSNIDGGFFLTSFFVSLKNELNFSKVSDPTWSNIVDGAIEAALYRSTTRNAAGSSCGIQNGIRSINIR
jgi:hypothetical protein